MEKSASKFKNNKKFRKNNITLVFDDLKRREFLTGFHKRKLQRKKKAQEQLKEDLKQERKRLKAEAKDSYKKLLVSHRTIPELETLLKDEYEEDDVTVKVLELSANALADQSHFIGNNQMQYEKEEPDQTPKKEKLKKIPDDAVPGMSLTGEDDEEEDVEESDKEDADNKDQEDSAKRTFTSQKDLKRMLKKQAASKAKKSKVFQKKNRVETQKQKKRSLNMKKQRIKFREKHDKHKKTRQSQ